jgi:hypothetical protein
VRFCRRKGAIKLHTLIDLRGKIPWFVLLIHGKTHDINYRTHCRSRSAPYICWPMDTAILAAFIVS